jgi:hypothetical protein
MFTLVCIAMLNRIRGNKCYERSRRHAPKNCKEVVAMATSAKTSGGLEQYSQKFADLQIWIWCLRTRFNEGGRIWAMKEK